MEAWEYMVLEQPQGVVGFTDLQTREQYPGSLPSVINAVGAEGWQVMSFNTLPDGRAIVILGRKGGGTFA
ncbi:MAG TPA: hypothetical protein VGM51_06140 [Armatimonadota bacterium]|jgi:hypothetical protein